MAKHVVVVLVGVLMSGCGHYFRNTVMLPTGYDPHSGYRYATVRTRATSPERHQVAAAHPSDTFIVLAFSGGGTRAAALAYGVLKELHSTRIVGADGTEGSLLDDVDVISSVSGGSFTAAYYGLYGNQMFSPLHADSANTEFKQKVLYRRIETALLLRVLTPWNWVRLASPQFSRTDLAAEYYDKHIFDRHTFNDLLQEVRRNPQRPRPYIILNATDMTSGSRFEFTQDQFDPLCSDLRSFPIGRAVAASSAFPGAFPALTVNNYAHVKTPCGYQRPRWVDIALEHDRIDGTERFALAQALDSYIRTHPTRKDFVHLLDGGVADNLGLRGPLQALQFNTATPWSLSNLLNTGDIKRLVVISVNAKNAPPSKLDARSYAPGILDAAVASATIPMENFTFETRELFQREMGDIRASLEDLQEAGQPVDEEEPQLYWAEVRFDALTHPKQREFFNNIGTKLQLDRAEVDALIEIAAVLICQEPEYAELRKALQVKGGCAGVDDR